MLLDRKCVHARQYPEMGELRDAPIQVFAVFSQVLQKHT